MTENRSDPVRPLIRAQWNDPSSVFVFPSDIAASLWLDKALIITGADTVATERFIAWDRFKEEAVQSLVAGKRPVSSVVRKLWARDLARRNSDAARESGTPLLTSIIPPEHAEEGQIFASWIAKILPQLQLWETKHSRATKRPQTCDIPLLLNAATDSESHDLAWIKTDYTNFLDKENLFEPSWQRPPITDTGKHYFLFFPEAIEDFSEYATLFSGSPLITLISQNPHHEPASATVFDNTREELQNLSLRIEALLAKNIAPESIAVSVPDLETVAPYLSREFHLRSIPFELRAGETLGTRPAGRIFSLLHECVNSAFSFTTLKSLLLNRAIPWKHQDIAERLIEFGVRNHCVTSWTEDKKKVDIWEEAFLTPNSADAGDWLLRDWYRTLRNLATNLCDASSFAEIRKHWFAFRRDLLDIEQMTSADNDVLARCIEEVSELQRIEFRYPALIPAEPFSFFVSVLSEQNYVSQRLPGGISVFPWRVAAGTPFDWHFVIDTSQNSATVLYRQLNFLREDRRLDLFLLDTDASDAFFSIYRGQGNTSFSFAPRTFAGYRTIHGHFAHSTTNIAANNSIDDTTGNIPYTIPGDPFNTERLYQAGGEIPDRLYPSQIKSIESWLQVEGNLGFSFLKEPFQGRCKALSQLLQEKRKFGDALKVSQSDLSQFGVCNTKWLLARVCAIEITDSDAELMNERNLGILFHSVLKDLYIKVRNMDGVFVGVNIDQYKEWATEIAKNAAAEHAEFKGPLARPIIDSLIRKIVDGIYGILQADAEILDGFIPELLEKKISFEQDGVLYNGVIDRISRDPSDNTLVLIDYKSGKVPPAARYKPDHKGNIGDYQIPMYLKLIEEAPDSPYSGQKIENAWFASIKEAKYRPIIHEKILSVSNSRSYVPREQFGPAMEAFDQMVTAFSEAVSEENFTRPEKLPWSVCNACEFRRICRTTYSVAPGL